ncbi:FKBP-type peptidyl-prolyl cis-trans isomerase [Polaribacter sp. HL-MS24]|uniref:FKBP-type peptidyl-prolyl cis-trans isomerase n=1 Tax=Polaribacter sp. HL-MS24 TaxID=3077735 RepID=UPI0029341633|nr:FKBP-type peptidyl-prolyl cis-trans isomerase [Polaribacter sp. HL-MS24]WOC40313.1 FKBP-type peptidyl-prolyl cis-trans isomerase [Polaribacter sp. HL-MS24]
MNKFKYIFALLIVIAIVAACGNNTNSIPVDDFDHEAQALIDNDSLNSFFSKHYYDADVDSLKTLVDGALPLSRDEKLKTLNVTENEIDYKLYYYENNIGNPTVDKGFPTTMDSVFVKYKGFRISKTDSISPSFDGKQIPIWFTLNAVIRGWSHGLVNFKNGDNVTSNGPITYENGGKGILFIPSGLAYRNTYSGAILPNENLIFYIDLYDFVKDTDHDNDGVPSSEEDPDGDGDPRNDDTDGNSNPNYLDTDDDGDGVLTIKEDANGDGNPSNDFSDSANPNLPDYLNPAIK